MVITQNQYLHMSVQAILKPASLPGLRLLPEIDRDPTKIVEFPRQISGRRREQKARGRSAVGDLRDTVGFQVPVEEIAFSILAIATTAGVSLLFL
jgi:hypothetical protein